MNRWLGLAVTGGVAGAIGVGVSVSRFTSNPSAAPAAVSPAPPASSASNETAIERCEWEPMPPGELKALRSAGAAAGDAFARQRCLAHEAWDYELEIKSTITGMTMRGRSDTEGRIPLIWFYGARPLEGHWEGFGTLQSVTIPLGAPTCPPALATVAGSGVYDFLVRRAQIALTDMSAIDVWIDAGPITETFDTLRLPACIGGGTSPTNFWENQFFLTHFADRSTYGLLITGWSSLAGPEPRGGALAISVTPETCRGMCTGSTTFTLHMKARPVP